MEKIRLQKRLAELGIASRREAERWIEQGRIGVNGKVESRLGTKVSPADCLSLDGKKLKTQAPPRVYFLLNKPDFCLTSRQSQRQMNTIYDLPPLKRIPFLLAPVGRLDFRSEGLLLLSNDGDWVHRLSHPRYKVARHYEVLVAKPLSKTQEAQMRKGIYFKDGPVKGIQIRKKRGANLGGSRGLWYSITVFEGRNRLIRRIFEWAGLRVLKLVRVGLGDLKLPRHLSPGELVPLLPHQIKKLSAPRSSRPVVVR